MDRKLIWTGLGLSAGTIGAALAVFQVKKRQDRWLIWQGELTKYRGEIPARRIIIQAQARWRSLCHSAHQPDSPALRKFLANQILPGLALYQALLAEKKEVDLEQARTSALEDVDRLFRAQTRRQFGWTLKPFQWFPNSWRIFRLGMRLRLRAFPDIAWKTLNIEDSVHRFALETYSCYLHQVLCAYGAAELTASFCATDDYMAELFPKTIKFERGQTLGYGGDCCDFSYTFTPASRS